MSRLPDEPTGGMAAEFTDEKEVMNDGVVEEDEMDDAAVGNDAEAAAEAYEDKNKLS